MNLRAVVDRIFRRVTTFEAFRGPSGLWFWRERASNGEITCVSESYKQRANAIRAAKAKAARVANARWKVVED